MPEFKSVFGEEIEMHLSVREAELSHEAYRHCRRTMILFDEFLYRINHKEKELPEQVIETWIKEVSTGISISTCSQHVYFIRLLLLFLANSGYSCFIPKTLKVNDTYVPYLYSDDEIEKIFLAADSLMVSRARKNRFAEKEIPLILRLLYCCGLRLGETINIKVGDLDFERNLIILRVTKKYKQRIVPVGNELAEIIHRYCIGMELLNDSEAFLFPEGDRNKHISADNVNNYFRTIKKNAGIGCEIQTVGGGRGACLHCFRHTFSVRSFDKNERYGIKASESVPFLSTYLGHDSLYETEKYLKFSGNYFEDVLSKFDDYSGELFPEVTINEES